MQHISSVLQWMSICTVCLLLRGSTWCEIKRKTGAVDRCLYDVGRQHFITFAEVSEEYSCHVLKESKLNVIHSTYSNACLVFLLFDLCSVVRVQMVGGTFISPLYFTLWHLKQPFLMLLLLLRHDPRTLTELMHLLLVMREHCARDHL